MKVGDLVRIQPHLTENRRWLIGIIVKLPPTDKDTGWNFAEVRWVNDGMREDTKFVEDLEVMNESR